MNILQITLKSLDDRSEVLASERAHVSHQIKAMIQREPVYKCRDYVAYCNNNKSKLRFNLAADAKDAADAAEEASLDLKYKDKDKDCHFVSPSVSPAPSLRSLSSSSLSSSSSSASSSSSSSMTSSPPPTKKRKINSSCSSDESSDESSSSSSSSSVVRCKKVFIADDTSRQEMCEWSFRIVDHFGGSRELIAIAQNYLDRFLGKYICDVTGFKLAAITCLCLAVKVHNKKPISMKSLSKLSSGEITIQEITEMESIILQALDWKLCPPTASNFCIHFHTLLPEHLSLNHIHIHNHNHGCDQNQNRDINRDLHRATDHQAAVLPDEKMRLMILQRACFFAELSLFDYSLILLNPSEVAFAAMLNGLEDVGLGEITKEMNMNMNMKMRGATAKQEEESRDSDSDTREPKEPRESREPIEPKKDQHRPRPLISDKCKQHFIEDIEFYSGLDSTSQRINRARVKLWALYRRSKQYQQQT